MRLISVLGLLILLLSEPIPTVAHLATPAAASPPTASDDFAGLVDIGDGRRLWLECRGQGSPTVILEAGAGNGADTWDTAGLPAGSKQTAVLPGVAAFTRVCAYDRPGTILDLAHRSRSDPVPMPRTASDVVADLHALLTAAAVPGPYVLAGHSFGGLVARLFAATYPDEVVGLVLIDAAHEDYHGEMRDVLTPEQRAEIAHLAEQGPPELDDYPDREVLDTDASATEMHEAAAASPLRPMPLMVLTHGRPWDWPPGYPAASLEALWTPLQEKLAALTPDSQFMVAEQSGHFIPGDQPDLVISAIQQVVEAARDPASWPITPADTTPVRAEATPMPSVSSWQFTPLLDSEANVPAAVAHRLTITPPPDLPIPASLLSFTGAEVVIDRRPPVVLGPPLSGSGWAALGSCCDGPHRRALQPIDGQWYLAQRFAIDFNQLDAQNRPGTGDPTLPTSFPTFGQPVLAVADAAVVEAVDRYPDLQVGQAREDLTSATAGGNRVALDLGDGRFAVYARLQAGSVVVQAGDRVGRGQVIAKVGSSGTTGGPHLHFQVTDRPSVVVGNGLPYVFDAFELTGQTPPLAEVLPYYDTLEPIPLTAERTGSRQDELPLGRDVVTFPTARTDASAATGDFSGLVDLGGGRQMFLQCRGQGGPTVILVSGFGNTGGAWTVLPDGVSPPAVLPGVGAFTRVCAYDRPGTLLDADPPDDRSRSDPVPQPTTAEAMVADLHALLTAAGVPGPYVLAGHSFGGLISRLYAATYPDDVVGLVLVDAFSEGVRAGLTPEDWQTWTATNGVPSPDLLAAYPELEQTDINAAADAMEQAAAARPLRAMPLVVLSAGRTGEMTPDQVAALPPGYPAALEAALQANALFLAGLAPDARLVTATDSGHYIQAEHPELVIEAIRQVVEGVRNPDAWYDLTSCCTA